jgi:anti-anti-sigma factor
MDLPRRVGFMDSTGLDVLIHARRMLDRDQRRLAVIAPPGPVLRAIEPAGLDAVLEVFPRPRVRAPAHMKRSFAPVARG